MSVTAVQQLATYEAASDMREDFFDAGGIEMKALVAMTLAASVWGCMTSAEHVGRLADAPPPASPAEPERASAPVTKYDASWYRAEYWGGEWPDGFTVDDDMTLRIRATPEVGAPKAKSCALRKGATYHPWNKKRVAADHLKFVTFTRIVTFELTKDYLAGVDRVPGDVRTTIKFKKGDRWSYLGLGSEGFFLMGFHGKTYRADNHLIDASTEVGGKPRVEHGNIKRILFANPPYGPRTLVIESHEWVRLTCTNGSVGWILNNEISNAPGLSGPNTCGYGCAEDRKPGDGLSPDELPVDKRACGQLRVC